MCEFSGGEDELERMRGIVLSPDPEEAAGGALYPPSWLAPLGLAGGEIRLLTELYASYALSRAPQAAMGDGEVVWGGKLAGDQLTGGIKLGVLVCGAYSR